jgi:hypothetical protein
VRLVVSSCQYQRRFQTQVAKTGRCGQRDTLHSYLPIQTTSCESVKRRRFQFPANQLLFHILNILMSITSNILRNRRRLSVLVPSESNLIPMPSSIKSNIFLSVEDCRAQLPACQLVFLLFLSTCICLPASYCAGTIQALRRSPSPSYHVKQLHSAVDDCRTALSANQYSPASF